MPAHSPSVHLSSLICPLAPSSSGLRSAATFPATDGPFSQLVHKLGWALNRSFNLERFFIFFIYLFLDGLGKVGGSNSKQ